VTFGPRSRIIAAMATPPPSLASLLAERALVGTFAAIRDPAALGFLAAGGFETVIIDGEHGVMNPETVGTLVLAAHASGIPAIVRVSASFRSSAQNALEAGADAVMAPMVESASQAESFASFCRYPPAGTRGFHPFTGGSGFGAVPAPNVVRFTNDRLVVLAQIETARGLDQCEAIAKAKGVDMLFFGPGDMSLSLGVPPGSPALAEAMERIARAAHAAGKSFGTFIGKPEEARRARELGAKLLILGGDGGLLLQAAWDAAGATRKAMGEG
jgi:4-hydroxy-2-oxoheptanedioate aldolase